MELNVIFFFYHIGMGLDLLQDRAYTQKILHSFIHIHFCSIYSSHKLETTEISVNKCTDEEKVILLHNGVLPNCLKNPLSYLKDIFLNLRWFPNLFLLMGFLCVQICYISASVCDFFLVLFYCLSFFLLVSYWLVFILFLRFLFVF